MYLKRYHDVTISKFGGVADPAPPGHGATAGFPALRAPRPALETLESQRPGHQVQIDVKFVEPLPRAGAKGVTPEIKPVGRRGKFYQFTAIDDCARLRVLKIYPKNNQKTTIQFLDYVLSQLLFQVEAVQTDIQAWWRSDDASICVKAGWARFHLLWVGAGVRRWLWWRSWRW